MDKPDFDVPILMIAQGWDEVRHKIRDEPSQIAALGALAADVNILAQRYPSDRRIRVWQGIVLAGQADVSNWADALRFAEQARRLLLAAEHDCLDQTTAVQLEIALGAIYDKAPGFPISFGDSTEAERHFRSAIAGDPDGLESNYYYADFLVRRHRYGEAKAMLQRALQAASREGREIGDNGVREDAAELLAFLGRRANR
jgi:tetratricopeptide (TPR) repeat protein